MATIESAIPWASINGTTDVVTLSVRLAILFTLIILVMDIGGFSARLSAPLGTGLSVSTVSLRFFRNGVRTGGVWGL